MRQRKKGIRIEVNEVTGLINGFVYYPTVKDSYLSCPVQPVNPDNVGDYCSRKFDWYSDIPLEKEKEHLNQFAEQLQFENAKGYIIYYAGQHTDSGEAQTRTEGAKAYLISARGIEAERISVMNGGQSEELITEL